MYHLVCTTRPLTIRSVRCDTVPIGNPSTTDTWHLPIWHVGQCVAQISRKILAIYLHCLVLSTERPVTDCYPVHFPQALDSSGSSPDRAAGSHILQMSRVVIALIRQPHFSSESFPRAEYPVTTSRDPQLGIKRDSSDREPASCAQGFLISDVDARSGPKAQHRTLCLMIFAICSAIGWRRKQQQWSGLRELTSRCSRKRGEMIRTDQRPRTTLHSVLGDMQWGWVRCCDSHSITQYIRHSAYPGNLLPVGELPQDELMRCAHGQQAFSPGWT